MLNVTAPSLEKVLNGAMRAFARGEFGEADRMCRGVLEVVPRHVVALTLMAALAIKAKELEAALDLAERAIGIDEEYADAHYQRGFALVGVGRFEEGAESYRRALELRAGFVEAELGLGVGLRKGGKVEEGVEVLRGLVGREAGYARGRFELAMGLKELGKFEEAIGEFREAVKLDPQNADGFYNLGVTFGELKRLEEAIAAYQLALRLRPGFGEALANLGAAMEGVGRLEEAVKFYGESLKLMKEEELVWYRLGVAMFRLKRFREAVEAFLRVTEIDPKRADAYHAMGLAWRGYGDTEKAIACCEVATEMEGTYAPTFLTLAALLGTKNRRKDACEVLRAGLKKFPEFEELAFELAMMSGEKNIRKLPTSVVYNLFENYAPMFEQHLVGQLNYRGPQQLMEGIVKVGGGGRMYDILDLGCGTGLCGVLFKPLARMMVGVDLANGMVERARARGIYDKVVQGELVETLRANEGGFDLVLAGDVFEYVGDLDEVFGAAKGALRDEGLFAFTVEKSGTSEMVLQSTVRFAHSLSYIRAVTERWGFEELYVEERALRDEGVGALAAWIVVLRKEPGGGNDEIRMTNDESNPNV